MGSWRHAPIGAITFNVALIHAAGLVLLHQAQPDAPKVGGGASRSQVVQMRLARATPNHTAAAQPLPLAPTSVPSDSPSSTPPPQAESIAPLEIDNILSDLDLEAGAGTQTSGSEYIPRPQLSTVPRPSTPVIVPFPKEIKELGRYTTILALFIDETGVVRRVRIDGPSLPKPLEDAARDSFLQAHFRPGEVQGQQVKSLIRVEVVFDNTPIESTGQPQSL